MAMVREILYQGMCSVLGGFKTGIGISSASLEEWSTHMF